MKFCMIATFYPPYAFGGDGNFVRHLAHELAARGHGVDVVHCRDAYRALGGAPPETDSSGGARAAPYETSSAREARSGDEASLRETDPRLAGVRAASRAGVREPPRVTVHGLESPFGALSPLATHQTGRPLFKTKELRRILAQPFDVIHYHNVSLVGGPKVLQLGDALKLYTFHEYWLVCPTNLLLRDGRTPCEEPRCTACTIRQGRPPQWWRGTRLLRDSLAHVDAFFSPSRFAIARHASLGLEAPIVHLPTFVPAGPPAERAPEADPYFLYAGRLELSKGPQTLIEPFRRFGRARLVLAGAGAEEQRLREAAAGCERIELRGPLPIEELRKLYRNAVAVIVPSLTFELFPLVLLEAFREGTPVLVRNRGSLPEVVADSGGGFVYDDDRELLAYAGRLLDEPGLREALGARGRIAFDGRWSAEAHLERYLGTIAELRAERAGRTGRAGGARRDEDAGAPPRRRAEAG